ncbi:MAG: hypothetical protein ACK4FS_05305 [Flavobacterium sp.]
MGNVLLLSIVFGMGLAYGNQFGDGQNLMTPGKQNGKHGLKVEVGIRISPILWIKTNLSIFGLMGFPKNPSHKPGFFKN